MKKHTSTLLLNICVFALYTIAGKIGLSLAYVNPSATAIWPPTGIALAAILFFGYRIVPAIVLGAFVVNITTAGTIASALGITLGNTLEGVVGAYLIKRFANGTHTLSTVLDIFKFVLLAAILSTTVSANIGVVTLMLSKLASWNNFFPVWTTWWLGDMSGALIVAPFFLIWGSVRRFRVDFKNILNLLLSFFILFLIADFVFVGVFPVPYLCIPIAVWIAFWFGRKGATAATIIVAMIAIFYTVHGFGPFTTNSSINQSLLLLQLFLGILSITSLTFAALIHTIRKGEKTLASHEARFQALIENSFDGVVLIDATTKIFYASPSCKRIMDYTPEELIGMIGIELIVPEQRKGVMQELAKLALKPGGHTTVEYQLMRRDQRPIWVEATGTNLLLEPDVNAVVVNFHEITDKKIADERLLQEKIRDEAMLKSIGDGIIATDDKGKITMANRVAYETLGWRRSELIGRHIVNAIPMVDETGRVLTIAERPMTKVLMHGKKAVTSKRNYYLKKDKKTNLPIHITVTPIIIEGTIVGTIEVFHDITREKEIDQMKDEFISLASHELRTPMTAINGLLSMIAHGDYGPVNEKLKHPFQNIQISAERQIHLINDLLNVSRLQSGKIEFTYINFSLRTMLEDSVKSLIPIAQQKGLQLTLKDEEEVHVHADEEWTKHIMNNLIGNALKFTEHGGVTISYYAKNDTAFIAVTDTGSGIDQTDQDKLFGKFQQLDRELSGKPPGSGLGLYLSRELAHKMEGEVQLTQSKIGRGSTFVLTIPLASQKGAIKQVVEKKIAIGSNTR
jgi:PAS domain S-box-containing protein